MGRPRLQLDIGKIELAASYGLTVPEIALLMGCGDSILYEQYVEYMDRGRANLCQSLKRKQVEVALAGNTTMLMWLGKQYLGQSDKTEVKQQTTGSLNLTVKVVEDDDWYGNKSKLAGLGVRSSNGNGKPSSNGNGRVRIRL